MPSSRNRAMCPYALSSAGAFPHVECLVTFAPRHVRGTVSTASEGGGAGRRGAACTANRPAMRPRCHSAGG
eukprot:15440051-Alexandrium_andersonii.AAC.1